MFNVSDSNSDSSNSIIDDLCKDPMWMKQTDNSIHEYGKQIISIHSIKYSILLCKILLIELLKCSFL